MESVRTSHTHPLRIDVIRVPGHSRMIGLTLRPGKREPGFAFRGEWKRDLAADLMVIKA